MKVSSRVDYAISCILRIADLYEDGRTVTINEIASKEKIEYDYVERLCVMMRKAGLLKSVRGASGGYRLAKDPSRISALEVVLAIDNEILELICFRKKGRRRRCIHLSRCKIRVLWQDLKDKMETHLKSYTIEKLIRLRRMEKGWRKGRGLI